MIGLSHYTVLASIIISFSPTVALSSHFTAIGLTFPLSILALYFVLVTHH